VKAIEYILPQFADFGTLKTNNLEINLTHALLILQRKVDGNFSSNNIKKKHNFLSFPPLNVGCVS
jgi:hypothetical protein